MNDMDVAADMQSSGSSRATPFKTHPVALLSCASPLKTLKSAWMMV